MKILQVMPFFSPIFGGSAIAPYNLSKALAKRGHQVTILTSDYKINREWIDSSPDIEVVPSKTRLNLKELLITPSMRKYAKERLKDFDVIHMHNYRSFQNIIVHHYATKYGVPYVLQAHGSLLRIIEKQRLKKLYDWVWGNKMLKDASKLIAVSKDEVGQHKQMDVHDRVILIPNGVDVNEIRYLPRYGQFREKYSIDKKHIILFLGRIHKRKGIEYLIKSFSELIKEIKDVVLVIAGPDNGHKIELTKIITRLNIATDVMFTGFIHNSLSAYLDADLLVHPAIYEIFGLVPFEAIMCGTPVIVADGSGCGEIVREADCGYLVKYDDINDLKNKMKLILENPEEGKKKIEQGRKFIRKNLTWDKVVRRVEEVYEDCIHNF